MYDEEDLDFSAIDPEHLASYRRHEFEEEVDAAQERARQGASSSSSSQPLGASGNRKLLLKRLQINQLVGGTLMT